MKQLGLSAEIIVDSFAGGGGASTGIEQALGHPVHIAINHDQEAVLLHGANHPHTKHFCEDIWEVDPRKVDPESPIGLLWASPDCKHFSKAKGGAPVSKRVRGLAWVVMRWAGLRKPRVIMLENVEEFTTWGPVDENGQPLKSLRGITFNSFVIQLRRHGYQVEWKELRACDYGAPTIRKRLFLIARRDCLPIIWPKATHGKPGSGLLPYRTAAEIIDWSIPCPSIFERKKPLAENTMRRIARGIQKYVVNNPKPFIVPIAHYNGSIPVHDVGEPLRTVTASPKGGAFAVVDPYIVKVNHGYDTFRGQSVHEPMQTLTAKHGFAVVTPVIERSFSRSECNPADAPLGTVTAGGGGKAALVCPTLVQVGYGERKALYQCLECVDELFNDEHATGVDTLAPAECPRCGEEKNIKLVHPGQEPRVPGLDKPLGTVVAGGTKHALVSAFLAKHYGGVIGTQVSVPTGTVTTTDHHSLVTAHILKMRGENVGHAADEPLHTVSAGGTHHAEVRAFLIKYFGTEQDPRLDEPLHTVTTKDRFGLVTIHGEEYQIVDIGMRMLTPRELYRAQGFPENYIIDRTAEGKPLSKVAQVRMCGNSVSPVMAKALVAANMNESVVFDSAQTDREAA